MKGRTSILAFATAEGLLLLALVVPLAHIRSFAELLLLPTTDHLPEVAPDEPWFILTRSLLVVLSLQACFALRDLYRWSVLVRPQLVVVRLVEALITALLVVPLLHYLLGVIDRTIELNGVLLRLQVHPFLVVGCVGVSFLAAYGLRMRWPHLIRGAGLAERVAIVGRGPHVDILEEELRRRHDPGLECVGFLDRAEGLPVQRHRLGAPGDAVALAREHGIQRLVVDRTEPLGSETLLGLREAGVNITDGTSFYERLTGRVSPESLSQVDLFLSGTPTSFAYRITKRVLDVVLALLGLILALPLCLIVALAVKLDSKGPLLYSQERVGANGREFPLSKFRSMRQDAESASGPVWASANDSRITRIGRWLRKLRIDEIPQLWSVVRNDMSLVGPRPERAFFVSELEADIPHYGRRHLVKPGVTGWAQINHSYGNTVDDAFIKLQYDLYYIKHRSLALDIAILLRTVKVVVLQEGAV